MSDFDRSNQTWVRFPYSCIHSALRKKILFSEIWLGDIVIDWLNLKLLLFIQESARYHQPKCSINLSKIISIHLFSQRKNAEENSLSTFHFVTLLLKELDSNHSPSHRERWHFWFFPLKLDRIPHLHRAFMFQIDFFISTNSSFIGEPCIFSFPHRYRNYFVRLLPFRINWKHEKDKSLKTSQRTIEIEMLWESRSLNVSGGDTFSHLAINRMGGKMGINSGKVQCMINCKIHPIICTPYTLKHTS